MHAAQEFRGQAESTERAARLKTGLRGFWQRLTGERRKIEAENRREADQAKQRDQVERSELQREEAETLTRTEKRAAFVEARRKENMEELSKDRRDILKGAFEARAVDKPDGDKKQKEAAFRERRKRAPRPSRRQHSREGPEP